MRRSRKQTRKDEELTFTFLSNSLFKRSPNVSVLPSRDHIQLVENVGGVVAGFYFKTSCLFTHRKCTCKCVRGALEALNVSIPDLNMSINYIPCSLVINKSAEKIKKKYAEIFQFRGHLIHVKLVPFHRRFDTSDNSSLLRRFRQLTSN